jgi:glycosyltransferase involved in cell wall biosynthesis
VASLSERKGILLLVQSLKDVKKSFPDFFIDIVGDGVLRSQLEEDIKLLGLSQNVSIHGFQPPEKLPTYFNNTDIFILPSLSEGFPLVVLSALSCGICTIVSDLTVFKELNAMDSHLLVLFKTNNQTSLSTTINHTIKNLEDFNKYKQKRRNFIVNNYDNSNIARRYSEIINNL